MKITNLDQLRTLYEQPRDRVIAKEQLQLDKHCKNFISKAPFMLIGTQGANGQLDNSPRGGLPGFVKVLDDSTLVIPDVKGNNRLDSISNIIETGKVGMLFLIPGVDETLRVNGTAYISTNADFLQLFSEERKQPITAIVAKVEVAFLQCAKALMRSKIWDPTTQIERATFPTMGQMLKDQLNSNDTPETQEEMIARYQKDL